MPIACLYTFDARQSADNCIQSGSDQHMHEAGHAHCSGTFVAADVNCQELSQSCFDKYGLTTAQRNE
eukprot:scaffold232789_cov19-Prasinocladus_malaysianus.AAC.1